MGNGTGTCLDGGIPGARFKIPLSIILGYTDSLLENTPDDTEKLRRYLTVIRDNTKKSTALVQQMQYASDLERSGLRLEPSPLDIAVFLTQKVQDYQLPARQKGITLSLHLPERIPRSVCTDADKLARILDNVISNSLQYTPQGGRIDISVKAEKTGCAILSAIQEAALARKI
ncbi:HAMP domain-containing histidine kinase [Blautia sp. RD014234]|nr:HAMP domain-containing histidine kinase [Blautia parvula]